MAITLWLTGLSASGKSTLALAASDQLATRNIACKIIDGDELRRGPCADLGYSRTDRRENIRRAARLCRLLNDADTVAIAALISPYREDREAARQIVGHIAFHEIFLATPLAICESRDQKDLYRRARAGEIAEFTGISDPYEAPLAPQLTLDTHLLSVSECVARIENLLDQGIL